MNDMYDTTEKYFTKQNKDGEFEHYERVQFVGTLIDDNGHSYFVLEEPTIKDGVFIGMVANIQTKIKTNDGKYHFAANYPRRMYTNNFTYLQGYATLETHVYVRDCLMEM